MAITRGAGGNLICVGEAEHDADVLLSLSALIKAAELRMVFEGILFFFKKRCMSCQRLGRRRSPAVRGSFRRRSTYNLMSLLWNDNGTGRKEKKGKLPPLRYFNLIVFAFGGMAVVWRAASDCLTSRSRNAAELMCLFPDEPQLEKCQI